MSSTTADQIDVRIKADGSQVRPGMDKAASDIKATTDQMKAQFAQLNADVSAHMGKVKDSVAETSSGIMSSFSSLIGGLGSVQGAIASIAAAVAGGAAFKAGIAAIKEQAGEAMGLARALGISASEASVLATALGNVFLDKDTYISGVRGITRALNTNGEAFDELGIKTKNAQGRLLPMQEIIANTVNRLNEFSAGADRNTMAQQLLSRSYEDLLQIAKVTDQAMADATQEVADYHKEIDPAAVKAYKEAMENMGDAVEGVSLAIGREAMPIMTELGNWLQQAGPKATEATIVAMQTLRDVYEALRNATVIVWQSISSTLSQAVSIIEGLFKIRIADAGEAFVNVFKLIRVAVLGAGLVIETTFEGMRAAIMVLMSWFDRLGSVAVAALHFDLAGVKSAWSAGVTQLEAVIAQSSERIVTMQSRYGQKIGETLAEGVKTGAEKSLSAMKLPGGGSKGSLKLGQQDDDKAAKDKKDPGRMPLWEAEMEKAREAYMLEHDLREMGKQDELAYWQAIAAANTLTANESIAVTKKTAQLRVAILKEEFQQRQQLSVGAIEEYKSARMDEVAAEKSAAEFALQVKNITELEKLALDRQFAEREYQIQREALQQRLALAEQDPHLSPALRAQILDQIAALERKHSLEMQKINQQVGVQENKPFANMLQTMQSGFQGFAANLLNRTQTLRQGLANLYRQMAQSFISEYIAKKATAMIADAAKEIALKSSTLAALLGLQAAGSATTVAAKATEATAVVGANAAEAASGAAASVSSIPFVGWAMAGGVFAATMAMVMGAKNSIPSARNGYDIPAGVNPITQLHEREMVLPKDEADTIRGLKGGGGSGFAPVINIRTNDSRDLERSLRKDGVAAKALARLHRDFTRI